GTAHGSYSVQVDAGSASSVTLNNLDDLTTYYFIVQSYDAGKAHYSVPTPEIIYSPLSIGCNDATASSSDGRPVVVNFPPPIVVGAISQPAVSCNPISGSLFSVGVTSVSCTATDPVATASCTGLVIVSDDS